MSSYTKLFHSILASTVWNEPNEVRIVWITMLAMANRDGVVEGSVPGLAVFARLSVPDVRMALERLTAPDQNSRSPELAGRRIEIIDGGWRLVNHSKYRRLMSLDDRREYARVRQAELRKRKSVGKSKAPYQPVGDMSHLVGDIRDTSRMSQEVPHNADTDTVQPPNPLRSEGGTPLRILRSDRQEAKRLLKVNFGHCTHDPGHTDVAACEAEIAAALAERRRDAEAAATAPFRARPDETFVTHEGETHCTPRQVQVVELSAQRKH